MRCAKCGMKCLTLNGRSRCCDGDVTPGPKDADCKHHNFACCVNVNRLEDISRFSADVTIRCDDCGLPFRFIGLPAGLDLNSPTVSVDGTEGRFPIAPKGEVLSEIEGTPIGFTIRKEQKPAS